MAQQKKGFITRMLEGKERSEEYARSTLPTNRWQLFWDIFKGNFGKIVKVNLLTLIFFIPMILVIMLYVMMNEANGTLYPFGIPTYPFYPNQKGLSEMLALQMNGILFVGLLISSVIASVGLAGGMYVVRNMVWTEGIFVSNDFWRGIKLNYKNALQTAVFFCAMLALGGMLINLTDFTLIAGNLTKAQTVLMRISTVTSYLMIVLAAMMSFWMIALGVNYQLKFVTMFKNAFLMTLGTFPQTIFFGVIALLPYALFLLGEMFMVIGFVLVLLFGIAYTLLVWLDFAQWVFDKYINPNIKGAKVGRGIYNRDGTATEDGATESAAALEYQKVILSHGRSRLIARPIKPIDDSLQVYDLPTAFTREDLQRLRESKQNIAEDTEAYAEEHKNDFRYVEYNRQFDEREKAVQEEMNKDGKKKKRKPKILGDQLPKDSE